MEMDAFVEKEIVGINMLQSLMQKFSFLNIVFHSKDGWVWTTTEDGKYTIKTASGVVEAKLLSFSNMFGL